MNLIAILNKPYSIDEKASFKTVYGNQQGCKIIETDIALEAWQYSDDEKAEQREAQFKTQFFKMPLDKSFADTGFGYYRKQPKGYQSAVESMQLAFTIANSQGGLPANTLIFYEEPDFHNPETLTEEWLVNHQIILPALTQEQFNIIFSAFVVAWNTQEHVNTESEGE